MNNLVRLTLMFPDLVGINYEIMNPVSLDEWIYFVAEDETLIVEYL